MVPERPVAPAPAAPRGSAARVARVTAATAAATTAIAASTALALSLLTGYTIAPTNLIVWSYLGQTTATPSPYNASGVAVHSGYSNAYPASLPVPSLPTDFNARIALMLPEKVGLMQSSSHRTMTSPGLQVQLVVMPLI